jgi:transposase-like protein
MTKLLLNEFLRAAERFVEAEAQAIQDWQNACDCPAPGKRIECRECPCYKKLGLLTQQKLDCEPEKVFAAIVPLEPSDPYSDSVKQQCLKMFTAGYSLQDIQYLNGIPYRQKMTDWFREVGLAQRSAQYPESVKQKCLQLYAKRWTLRQIEEETGVPADTIADWGYQSNLSRDRKYPEELKQHCLDRYLEGKTSNEIHLETGIPAVTISMWIWKADISRSQKRYSEAEKRDCLALYESGKSLKEIEAITGIKYATIGSWVRKENWSRGRE